MAAPIKRTPWLRPNMVFDCWTDRYGALWVCRDQLEFLCETLFGEAPDFGRDEVHIHAQESPSGEWRVVGPAFLLESPIGTLPVFWALYHKLGGHGDWRGHVWIEWRER